jgi:hypothetical protein
MTTDHPQPQGRNEPEFTTQESETEIPLVARGVRHLGNVIYREFRRLAEDWIDRNAPGEIAEMIEERYPRGHGSTIQIQDSDSERDSDSDTLETVETPEISYEELQQFCDNVEGLRHIRGIEMSTPTTPHVVLESQEEQEQEQEWQQVQYQEQEQDQDQEQEQEQQQIPNNIVLEELPETSLDNPIFDRLYPLIQNGQYAVLFTPIPTPAPAPVDNNSPVPFPEDWTVPLDTPNMAYTNPRSPSPNPRRSQSPSPRSPGSPRSLRSPRIWRARPRGPSTIPNTAPRQRRRLRLRTPVSAGSSGSPESSGSSGSSENPGSSGSPENLGSSGTRWNELIRLATSGCPETLSRSQIQRIQRIQRMVRVHEDQMNQMDVDRNSGIVTGESDNEVRLVPGTPVTPGSAGSSSSPGSEEGLGSWIERRLGPPEPEDEMDVDSGIYIPESDNHDRMED